MSTENQNKWASEEGLKKIDNSACEYFNYWETRSDSTDVEPDRETKIGKTNEEFSEDIRTAVALEADRMRIPFGNGSEVISYRRHVFRGADLWSPGGETIERFFGIDKLKIKVDYISLYHGNAQNIETTLVQKSLQKSPNIGSKKI
jgi:hypothetical protein